MNTETFPTNTDDTRIPDNLRESINDRLVEGETIWWIDQPIFTFRSLAGVLSITFGMSGLVFTLVAIGLIGYGICQTFGLFDSDGFQFKPIFLLFSAFGIPFLYFGLSALYIPFEERWIMRQTIYAITNYRAIIAEPGKPPSFDVRSFYPPDIVDLRHELKENGRGNLYFFNDKHQMFRQASFFNIRNVWEVERMMQELKNTKSQKYAD